jgi:hypothetical protein
MLKFNVACGAALKLPLPPWFATMLQTPGVRPLTVTVLGLGLKLPETVQTLNVLLLKMMVNPDEAVALTMPVSPTATLGAGLKVIVWGVKNVTVGNESNEPKDDPPRTRRTW